MNYKSIVALLTALGLNSSIAVYAQMTPEFEDRVYVAEDGETIRYRLYLPDGYEDSGREYPTVTWINGASGDVGDRPQSLVNTLREGDHAGFLIEPFASGGAFHTCQAPDFQPHVHCAPELPRPMEMLLGAIQEVESMYPANPDQRVLSGYSAGGVATFNTVRERPDFFSAAVPFASGHEARRFREPIETRIWAVHGDSDQILLPYYSSSVVDAISRLGDPPIYQQPQFGHRKADATWLFAEDDIYDWMFDSIPPRLPTLVYEASTGHVIVDASKAPGGSISKLSLPFENPPMIDSIGADQLHVSDSVVTYEAADGIGFGGIVDLGPILPTGLGFTEIQDALARSTYSSPAEESPFRAFQIKLADAEELPTLQLHKVEEPWIAFEERPGGRIRDQGAISQSRVGGPREQKLVHKYLLPQVDQDVMRLTNATMRIFVENSTGEGSAVVRHSGGDNVLAYEASDPGDGSNISGSADLVSTNDAMGVFYDIDVTSFVSADYANDPANAVSTFGIDTDGEEGARPMFLIGMSKDRQRFPSLQLTFISAVVDCVPDAVLNGDDLSCVTTIEARDFLLEEIDSLVGDLDADGEVDFDDFLTLAANFGSAEGNYAAGDIDLTGSVDFADFLILSVNFSSDQEISSVPEPTSAELLIHVLLVGLIGTCRRRSSM